MTTIRSALLETGISPSRLELEVTETALINDLNRALHNLRQIKALGISIALDDFGTGYSSLSLLNSFPFDRIKIDKSFIAVAGSNTRADAIFKTVIGLGAVLGVPVLVEGVETGDQLAMAVASGCEEVQGFYFGQPIRSACLSAISQSLLPIDPHMEVTAHLAHLEDRQHAALDRVLAAVCVDQAPEATR